MTMTKRDIIPRIGRWWLQLQEYDCEIEYRPGSRMSHVDSLSLAPVDEASDVNETYVIDVLKIDIQDWIATVQSNDDEIKWIREFLSGNDSKYVLDVHKNYRLKKIIIYTE